MPNHLTPEELSREFGIDRAEVIRICVEEHVPVYHGRIDKTLFEAVRLTQNEPHWYTRRAPPDPRGAASALRKSGRAGPRHPTAATLGGCASAPGVRSLLVVLALALPAAHPGTAAAATGPRERTALLELFATDAALARAQRGAEAAHARLARVRGDLRSLARQRLGVARAQPARHAARARAAPQRDLPRRPARHAGRAARGALVRATSATGLDLLDRLSRPDSSLVRSARRWHAALAGSSRTLRAAEARAQAPSRPRGRRAWRRSAGRRARSARCSRGCGASTCAR